MGQLLKFHSFFFYLYFMITVVYFYTQFGFRFHLLPFNITTARACTAAFHYYLGIIYGILLCVFLSGVRDFTAVIQGLLTYLCTLLGHNISNYLLIIASHHLRFTHIILGFPWQHFRVKHCSHICLLLCFPIFLLLYLVVALLYKYGCYRPPRLDRTRTRTPTNLL